MTTSTNNSNLTTQRGTLRVMFVLTSMPVGGAETLLASVVRRMDRRQFAPEICCLKQLDPLGEEMSLELPAHCHLIGHKYDPRVLWRLMRLYRQRQVDAVITVGTGGDKMFWGRLAAFGAGVPVVASALHSTGLPDRVERSNRLLARWTDAFIAVAPAHGQYIAEKEGCPADKVHVIPNGVDVARFRDRLARPQLRRELGLPADSPLVGIVAALRPEKDHELFLRMAARVRQARPGTEFVIVGDGPRRAELQDLATQLGIASAVHFLGTRSDVERLLPHLAAVVLTSKMEANPVSILEALAACRPVVAPRVGSIPDVIADGVNGRLYAGSDEEQLVAAVLEVLTLPDVARELGRRGRETVVERYSVEAMVAGYENLVRDIYESKRGPLPPLAAVEPEAPPTSLPAPIVVDALATYAPTSPCDH